MVQEMSRIEGFKQTDNYWRANVHVVEDFHFDWEDLLVDNRVGQVQKQEKCLKHLESLRTRDSESFIRRETVRADLPVSDSIGDFDFLFKSAVLA